MRIILSLFLLFFISYNTTTTRQTVVIYDTIYKDTTIVRTKYKDTLIVRRKDTPVYVPVFVPAYLQKYIRSGEVKYTIKYK